LAVGLGLVLVGALLGADICGSPLAHQHSSAAGVDEVGRAFVHAQHLGGIPHAVAVAVARSLSRVLGRALAATDAVPGASGVGVALHLVVRRAGLGAGAGLGVVHAAAASVALRLVAGGGAGRLAHAADPSASNVVVARVLSSVTELALEVAGGAGPDAHALLLAGVLQRDERALSLAGSGVGVPHAQLSVLPAFVDIHVLALLRALARRVVPGAHRVASAVVEAAGDVGLGVVAFARVDARAVEGVPAAAGVGLAGGLRCGTVAALQFADAIGPLAHCCQSALSGGSLEAAESCALVTVGVPCALERVGAGNVVGVRELAATLASGGDVIELAHVLVQAVALGKAVAAVHASRDDGIPHALGVGVACALAGVAEDALLQALRAVARGNPVASCVRRAVAGVRLVDAALRAPIVHGVPAAHRLSAAVASGAVEAARLHAGRGRVLVHALAVGIALGRDIGLAGVAHLAEHLASVVAVVHGAHAGLSGALRGGEVLAAGLTASGLVVEHAVRVCGAALAGEALRRAARLASRSSVVPLAGALLIAVALSRVLGAGREALTSVGVPAAVAVGAARSGVEVAVDALLHAFSARRPRAHAVREAVALVVRDAAVATALAAQRVPRASSVVVARRLGLVGEVALRDAAERARPFAEGGSVAHGGLQGNRRGFVGEPGAAGRAEVVVGVPHAAAVAVARWAVGVSINAGLDTLLAAVGIVAAEAGAEERAASIGSINAGSGRVGILVALRVAGAVDPLALVIRNAERLSVEAAASGLADAGRNIPLAVGAVSVAGGLSDPAVLALLLAGAGVVVVDAHGPVQVASRARREPAASLLACTVRGVPHAAQRVGLADRLRREQWAVGVARLGRGVVHAVRRGLAGLLLLRGIDTGERLAAAVLAVLSRAVELAVQGGCALSCVRTVALGAAQHALVLRELARRVVLAAQLRGDVAADANADRTRGVPAAHQVGVARFLRAVRVLAGLAAGLSQRVHAERAALAVGGLRGPGALLGAERLGGVPHRVVLSVGVAIGLGPEPQVGLRHTAPRVGDSRLVLRQAARVGAAGSSVGVQVAAVVAAIVLEAPDAETVGAAHVASVGLVALLHARLRLLVPDAVAGEQRAVGLVLGEDRALGLADTRAIIPLADGAAGNALSVHVEALALDVAVSEGRIPQATRVRVAVHFVGVRRRALLQAVGAVPGADRARRAGGGVGDDAARRETLLRVRVPCAVRRVGVAARLGRVAVLALHLARVVVAVPLAHGVRRAGSLSGDQLAVLAAALVLRIPDTLEVVVAWRLGAVRVLATLLAALVVRRDELAHVVLDTGLLDLAGAQGRVVRGGVLNARLAALALRAAPHAVAVGVARTGGAVLDATIGVAGWRSGAVGEVAAGGAGALVAGQRTTGRLAATEVHDALGVGLAVVQALDLGAVLLALALLRVPRAGALGIARRLVGAELVAASLARAAGAVPQADLLVRVAVGLAALLVARVHAGALRGVHLAVRVSLALLQVGSVLRRAGLHARRRVPLARARRVARGHVRGVAVRVAR